MLKISERDIITRLAAEHQLEAAALCAIVEVESAGKATTLVGGKPMPLIRFEGHYFDRRLTGNKKTQARAQGLAHPNTGKVKNPSSQSARYSLLNRAKAIDTKAALESTSWGLGQVMGAHWTWLGYPNVDALVAEASSGFEGQVRLMLRFILKSNLEGAIQRRDWVAFARVYNGPAYRKNRYDQKLASAYKTYASAPIKPAKGRLLSIGAMGADVKTLQILLTSKGYYCAQDGIFGPKTRAALMAFQTAQGLVADAIVGDQTQRALGITAKKWSWQAWLSQLWQRLGTGFAQPQ